jgi:ribose transport system substrate-binding protein
MNKMKKLNLTKSIAIGVIASMVGLVFTGSAAHSMGTIKMDSLTGAPATVDTSAEDAAIRKLVNGRTIKLGFAPPILSEAYTEAQQGAWNQMADYSKRYGVKWVWTREAPLNNAHSGVETAGFIQNYVAKKYDAVFVCSAAPAATMQQLYKLGSAKGVEFYQFNSTEQLNQRSQATSESAGLYSVSNISYDNRWQSGALAAKYIAKNLKGKGQIIMILGPAGSDWTKLREQGFRAVIAQYPGLKIVGSADGGYVRDKGLTAAADLLTKYPTINAIYGENEDMALGASAAIDAAHLKHWDGTSGIITIGADGLVSGMDEIRKGNLTATVDVGYADMGRTMIRTMFSHLVLGMDVNQFVRVPSVVVDNTNVDIFQAQIKAELATKIQY